jgi:hypothetical protein
MVTRKFFPHAAVLAAISAVFTVLAAPHKW